MTKSLRLIIIFAVTAALIITFLLISSNMKKRALEKQESQRPEIIKILDIEENGVREITLDNKNGRLVFVREDGFWQIDPEPGFQVITTDIDNMARMLRTLTAVRVVEESPDSLSPYGLEDPGVTATLELSDGSTVEVYVGAPTPGKDTYYAMVKGDPRVFTVRAYAAERIGSSLEDFRQTRLTHIDKETLEYLWIEEDGERPMEFVVRDEETDLLIAPFAVFVMTRPYKSRRGTDTEKFSAFLESIPFSFTVEEFVEEEPGDLEKYGLENPERELIMRDAERELHLLIGNSREGSVYARENRGGPVFTLPSRDLRFLNTRPFDLTDKFALIINIDYVDTIRFTVGDESYSAEIKRKPGDETDDETEYYFNGKAVEEKPFKEFYQKLIGLIVDAEHPEPERLGPGGELGSLGYPEVVIEYGLNIPSGEAGLSLFEYNRDFYAVERDGVSEFLLSRSQVQKAIDSAEVLAGNR